MKKLKKYKKIIYAILIIVVLFGGNKIYQIYKKANPNVDFTKIKLEKRDLRKTISVDGEVVADYEISLASEIPGIISKVYVKEGQYVKKGQLLMKLKDSDYRNQVNSAYVNQKINEVAYEKTKKPNHNLDLDKEILEDSRETILKNVQKTKNDIQSNLDSLGIYLSQILRMEIDDYFDHTEFDSDYREDPIFTYRLKSRVKVEQLEKERQDLAVSFKNYKLGNKNVEESVAIIQKFENLVFNLYKNSRDFLGFSDPELEAKEKYLSNLKNQISQKKNTLINLETQLAQLNDQLKTNKKTEKKIENVVNPIDLKMAQEKIKAAQAQTHNAYTQLQKTYIRAPKSGIVVNIFKEAGEYAAPSASLIKINSKKQYIEADIPEVDIAKVKKGMRVEIKLDAFGEKIFNGKIDFIYPEKKEIFGITYYRARILFNEKDLRKENILPGMTAEVIIPFAEKHDVLSVERGVAKKDEDNYFVWLLNPKKELPKDAKFIKKYFEAGFVGDKFVEIKNDELISVEVVELREKKEK